MANRSGGDIKFRVGFQTNQASLNELKKSLQDLQKIQFGDFKGSIQQFTQVKKEVSELESLIQRAFNPTLNTSNITSFKNELEKSGLSLKDIQSNLSRFGAAGDRAFNQMATSVLTTNLKLKETNSLLDSMGKTMVNTVKWGVASSIMNTFTQSVQGAFQYVQSLEKSLTNIRIVTGDSTEKMAQFAQQANKSAQALGRSTLDYSKASLTFYQQGLNDEDVQARTEATLKAQNITGAGSQMANYLTAVWNGYKVANEEAELYVDKLAAVADSSASDMSQLAVAMSKVASTANNMGVDIDQLNAQIATVVATTRQAPESVGTAFKTIYTRINDIKAGSDEAEISLGNYSGKMAQLGVNVLDATGHLRDTGQVMDQIGERWATMTKEQQVYLAQTMGGQRQVNQLMALFDNWTTYSQLLNTSLEAEGTLVEKNSRYMESLGAKMEQLGAAGERVKSALIDSDSMKSVIEALTSVTNLVANLFETMGSGNTVLLALGSTMTQLFSGTIAKEINSIIVNMQNMKTNAQTIKDQLEVTKMVEEVGKGTAGQNIVISNLKEIQQYYSVMDEASINNQKNLIAQRAQIQNNIEDIKNQREEVEKLAESFGKTKDSLNWKENTGFEEINEALGNLEGSLKNIKGITSSSGNLFQNFTSEDNIGPALNFIDRFEAFLEDYKNIDRSGADALKELWDSFRNNNISGGEFFQGLQNAVAEAEQKGKQLTDTINNSAHALSNVEGQARLVDGALKQNVDSAKQLFDVTNATKFVGAVGQIASTIMTIKNLGSILSDKDVSAGEKIAKVLTTAGFVVPTLVSAYKVLKTSGYDLLKNEAIKLATLKLQTKELERQALIESFKKSGKGAGAIGKTTKEIDEIQQHLKGLQNGAISGNAVVGQGLASIGTTLVGMLPVLIAIGAAVGAIYLAYKDWNKEAEAAKKAHKLAEDAKKVYDDLKTSLDDVKSALDDLHAAEDNLDGLTKGTQEWRDALQQCNDKVLELISNYPELAQYVINQNGQLKLSAEGEQAYLDQLQAGVSNARNASYIASSQARQADATALAASIGHNVSKGGYSAGQGGGYAPVKEVEEIVLALDKVLEKNNIKEGELANGFTDLADQIAKQTNYTEQYISSILSDTEEIIQLRNQLQQNELADKTMYDAMAAGVLQDNSRYKEMNQLEKQLANTIGGIDLEAAYKDSYEDWIKRMSGMNMDRFDSASDVQDILAAFNKAQGTQWRMDSNAVRGGQENRLLAFVEEDGKTIHELTRQQVASAIATKQALDKLGTSADKTAEILSAINTSDKTADEKTAIQQFLAGQDINVSQDVLKGLSGEDLKDIFGGNLQAEAKELGYDSGKQFIDAFNRTIELTKEQYASITDGLLGPVKEQLENSLADDKYLLGTQKNLREIFSKTFEQSGSEAMSAFEGIKDKLEETTDLTKEQKEDIVKLFAEADLSTPEGLNSLEQSLRNIDASIVLNSQDWQKFKSEIQDSHFENPVDKIFDQKASVDGITKNLKVGSVISEEDLNTLKELDNGVQDFFKRTIQGYQFVGSKKSLISLLAGSTPDYIQAANNLDNLKDKAVEISNIIGENTSISDLSEAQVNNYTQAIMNKIGGDKQTYSALGTNQDYVNSVKQELQQLMQVAENERDEDWQAQYNEKLNFLKQFITNSQLLPDILDQSTESLRSAAALESKTLSELVSKFQSEDINSQQFGEALQKVSQQEMSDLGFDPQEYEQYVNLLQATNEEYAENEYLARQVANANMRITQGTQDLIDNWKDWEEIFKDYLASGRDIGALTKKWGQMKETLANLFDMDKESFDLLGPDFVADNLDKIEAVKDGIPGAYEDLEGLIEENLWGKLENSIQSHKEADDIDLGEAVTINYDEVLESSQGLFDQLQSISDNANIEVGTTVDDTNLIAGLNNMIDASGMASDKMAAIFDGMGYDVEFQEKPDKIHKNSEDTQYYVPPTYRMESLGNASLGIAGLSLPVNVPVIDQEGHYESTHGDKETYEPGTYAIKTITKNGKGNGGNISRKTANSPSNKSGNGGGGGHGGGGKGKGSQPKAAKKIDGPNKQKDRYRKVNIDAKKQANALEKLQKQQDRLTGKSVTDNLLKQLGILKKQYTTIKEKLKLQKQERDQLQNSLKKYGATFDKSSGTLTNYNKVFDKITKKYQDIVAWWNKLSGDQQDDEKNKTTLETAKKEYEKAMKQLQRYDVLNEDEIQKQIQAVLDNVQAQIDLKVQKFNIQIDATLNLSQARKDFLDFQRDIKEQVRDDDIKGLNEYAFKNLGTYYNSNQSGTIQTLQKQLDEALNNTNNKYSKKYYDQNKHKMVTMYDKQAQQKDIERLTEELAKEMGNYDKLVKEIEQSIFDMIDQTDKAFQQQIDEYEFLGDLIDHNVKVTQLLFGDQAYEQLDHYYDRIEENNNAQLDFLRQRQQMWYGRMMEEQARMAQEEYGSDAYMKAKKRFEEYQRLWMESQKDLNAQVEKSIQDLQDKYANTIDNIFTQLELKWTGGLHLDTVQDEWDKINDLADMYLDKVNGMYQIDKLENAFQDAIDNAEGSLSAQQSLNELMNEQLAYLRDKDKLTQYDVDRANALLQIEVKRLALEQSRNSKTKLRLRRDSQGNYSYQYTGDQEQQNKAQQELSDAQNSLYNSTKQAYLNNLSDINKAQQEAKEAMAELYKEENQETEDFKIREANLIEYFNNKINGLNEQNAQIRNDLMKDSFDELSKMYGINAEQFNRMTEMQKNSIMTNLIPQWSSLSQQTADNLKAEGGFYATIIAPLKDVAAAQDELYEGLDKVQKKSGQNFAAIANDTDKVISQAKRLLESNKDLVKSNEYQIKAVQSTINTVQQLVDKYKEAREAAADLVEAGYQKIFETNFGLIGTTAAKDSAATKAQYDDAYAPAYKSETSASDIPGYTQYKASTPTITNVRSLLGDNQTASGNNTTSTLPSGQGVYNSVALASMSANQYQNALNAFVRGGNNATTEEYRKSLDVLTKTYEAQMKTVSANTKSITSTLENRVSNINSNLDKLIRTNIAKSNELKQALVTSSNKKLTVDQKVNIQANFPNLVEVRQIQDAFNSLINRTAQMVANQNYKANQKSSGGKAKIKGSIKKS